MVWWCWVQVDTWSDTRTLGKAVPWSRCAVAIEQPAGDAEQLADFPLCAARSGPVAVFRHGLNLGAAVRNGKRTAGVGTSFAVRSIGREQTSRTFHFSAP